MELKTLVFEKAGKQNTAATLQIAKERALALGIKQIVVASSHGYTARQAHALFAPAGIQVIAVSICHSWEGHGWTMSADTKAELQQQGVMVHTGIHASIDASVTVRISLVDNHLKVSQTIHFKLYYAGFSNRGLDRLPLSFLVSV